MSADNADGPTPTPPTHARMGVSSVTAGGARDSRWKFLDGLDRTVNGAASAELAAASSDIGTTITEQLTISTRLELARRMPQHERQHRHHHPQSAHTARLAEKVPAQQFLALHTAQISSKALAALRRPHTADDAVLGSKSE